jgi:hypothetical protein
MKRKYYSLVLIFVSIAFAGCIKETYNMDKLSDDINYSPTFSITAVNGKITLSDVLKANDTIKFDNDNFVRVVFKKDSVFDLKLADFYDLDDMVKYSMGYTIGEIKMRDFQATLPVTLNTISQSFSSALRSTFVTLNDGSPHIFPPFPATTIPDQSFSVFQDFQYALLSSGSLDISVKNNLQATLNGVRIKLYNASGHTQIGTEMIIPAINPGTTQTASMNLAGKTITNSIIAAVTFDGSPGTTSPVIINLNQTVDIGISGYNMRVESGRLKIPPQTISSVNDNDTIPIDPGENIEIEKLRVNTGNLTYTLISNSSFSGSLTVTLPTSLRSGVPISETIIITPGTNRTSAINVGNTELDLSKDPKKQYNKIPVIYTVVITSNESMVNFSKNDSIHLELKMQNPDFDYLKGYFGQRTEQMDSDSLDTDIDDILSHISGQFHISDPSVRVNYSNSFGIPFEVTLNASGVKDAQKVNLGLAPFMVAYPVSPASRVISSSFTVNKANSSLPELISMPPKVIRFSGSGRMNPLGFTGTRDNYIFGNSRFVASLEVEVPMTLWINNLQFADTLDNFLKPDNPDNDSPDLSETDLLVLKIATDNAFPLGASLQIALYDSASATIKKTITVQDLIKAAPVDANGKSSGTSQSVTTIECDKSFFDASKNCDKLIFIFTLKSSGDGTKDVRIYSDYSLTFKVGVKVKPQLQP